MALRPRVELGDEADEPECPWSFPRSPASCRPNAAATPTTTIAAAHSTTSNVRRARPRRLTNGGNGPDRAGGNLGPELWAHCLLRCEISGEPGAERAGEFSCGPTSGNG